MFKDPGNESGRTGMSMQKVMALTLCALILAAAGCKKTASSGGEETATRTYVTIDPDTAGTISGTIHFTGKAPARVLIDMGQDPACALADANYSEQYVVHDGGLQNVFIYVKDGLGNKLYAPPSEPVVMDQKGCRFVPHVIGVMAGQPVKFTNSDSTMHNVHMTPAISTNQTVDLSEPPSGPGEMRTLGSPELMIPVRCNNHPWMEAFINVTANPFYAVSDENGRFTIKGLPPGTYTLVANHEVLGTQTATITVTSKQTSAQDFTFGRADSKK
jgi:plastocyanin